MVQVAYVLVTTGWDRHSQMAWLSAQSVRVQQPDARIVVVAEVTVPGAQAIVEEKFRGLADTVLFKTSDIPSPLAKSRYHKMVLREYVAGDVIYLDSDTLVVAPFADAMRASGDVGAALDFNHGIENRWFPPELEQPFKALGWDYPLRHYFNAGVILLRDTPGVHAMCADWLARFRASTVLPHVWDQATFNSALFASGLPFAVLPAGYNAMVVKRNYDFRTSSILHFFGSDEEQRGTLMAHLLKDLAHAGTFDRRAYDRSIRQRHPWGPNPEAWQLHRSRNYVRAAFAKATQALRRTR